MENACRFKVVDTGAGLTWSREFISHHASREAAAQAYIDACAAAGIAHGLLNVFRVRDLAVAA